MSSINLQGSNQGCHSFSISCSSTIIAWCHLLIFKAATRAPLIFCFVQLYYHCLMSSIDLQGSNRVATHFLFQYSLTFSWLFTIFQTFSTASQLPLQLSSAIKSSNRALTFRELNNHLIREWGRFCKFMFLKIKETAIAICFQKFSKFPDFCRFFFCFCFSSFLWPGNIPFSDLFPWPWQPWAIPLLFHLIWRLVYLTLCMLGNFACFFCRLWIFF